jgi:hypothetical protein
MKQVDLDAVQLLLDNDPPIYEIRVQEGADKVFFCHRGQLVRNRTKKIIDIARNDNYLKVLGIRRYEVTTVNLKSGVVEVWKYWEDPTDVSVTNEEYTDKEAKELKKYIE